MVDKIVEKSAEEIAEGLAIAASKVLMDDYTWKYFEYNGRPKRGRIFNEFIDKEELKKETFLLREFFTCAIASALEPLYKSNNISRDLYVAIGHRTIDLTLSQDLIAEAFRFDNNDDAYNYLVSSLNDYLFKDYDDFSRIFINRVRNTFSPDTREINTFISKWSISAAFLFTDISGVMKLLRNTTRQHYLCGIIDDIESKKVNKSVNFYHNNQSTEKQLSKKLQITSHLNERYSCVYDNLMNQKIGQSINHESLSNELKTIKNYLIDEMKENQYIYTDTIEEANLIKSLIEYQELLINRIETLQSIINKLSDKIEGIGEKYSIIKYMKDLNYVKKLEKQVEIKGRELQSYATVYLKKISI